MELLEFLALVLAFSTFWFFVLFLDAKTEAKYQRNESERYRDMWDEAVGWKKKPDPESWTERIKSRK